MTYRGVVTVPTQQSAQSDQTETSHQPPVLQSSEQKLPYPAQPDQQLPYPVQPGDQQLPYPVQPAPPAPPSYEVASLPYPADNKTPPYHPYT